MNRSAAGVLLFLAATAAACAAPPPGPATYRLAIEGDRVRLRFHELPLGEFVKLAQRITTDVYTYDATALADAGPFSVIGEIDCPRDEFDELLATLLRAHGLQAEVDESQPIRVVRITCL